MSSLRSLICVVFFLAISFGAINKASATWYCAYMCHGDLLPFNKRKVTKGWTEWKAKADAHFMCGLSRVRHLSCSSDRDLQLRTPVRSEGPAVQMRVSSFEDHPWKEEIRITPPRRQTVVELQNLPAVEEDTPGDSLLPVIVADYDGRARRDVLDLTQINDDNVRFQDYGDQGNVTTIVLKGKSGGVYYVAMGVNRTLGMESGEYFANFNESIRYLEEQGLGLDAGVVISPMAIISVGSSPERSHIGRPGWVLINRTTREIIENFTVHFGMVEAYIFNAPTD